MKKALVMLLLLLVASTAQAGLIDLVITSWGPEPDPGMPPVTQPIDPTKEITIKPSEWVDIDILYYGDPPVTYLFGLGAYLNVDQGLASLDMSQVELGDYWASNSGATEEIPGQRYQIVLSADFAVGEGFGQPATDPAPIILGKILLHCDGPGDIVIVSLVDDQQGNTIETDLNFGYYEAVFGGPIIIHQVPEPMTLSLLGLGGLGLLRRRR
jgi:hypothetical protein